MILKLGNELVNDSQLKLNELVNCDLDLQLKLN